MFRGGYGISQYMEGTGANLRLPLNPPFFFESNVNYDATTGAGSMASGFADLVPGTTPTGNVRAYDLNLRPQFTHQWNVFAEYRLTDGMSAQVGYVGNRANHLVAPVEGNQALAGRGRSVDLGAEGHAPAALRLAAAHHHDRDHGLARPQRVQLDPGERAPARVARRSSSWPRTRSPRPTPTTAATTAAAVSSPPRAPTGRTPTTPTRSGDRRSTTCATTSCSRAPTSCRSAAAASSAPSGAASLNALFGGWKLGGIFQARTGIPVTVIDGRARSLQGERGFERPNCIGDPVPSNQSVTPDASSAIDSRWLNIGAFEAAALGTFGNCGIGIARAPGYVNLDAAISKRFNAGAERYFEFRVEAFNVTNTPSFGPPARDISVPNTFGLITTTVSSPRVIEFALKFYF